MDENQQPFITQKRGRLFSTTRGGGRRGQSRELFNFGAGESSASAADKNNTSFAIPLTTKWTIEEIWGTKTTSKKPCKLPHKSTSGKVSHSLKEVFLIPDPSIKVVPRKKRRGKIIILMLLPLQ